eukprot:1047260-Pelagomonas_calceolata.AAC.6
MERGQPAGAQECLHAHHCNTNTHTHSSSSVVVCTLLCRSFQCTSHEKVCAFRVRCVPCCEPRTHAAEVDATSSQSAVAHDAPMSKHACTPITFELLIEFSPVSLCACACVPPLTQSPGDPYSQAYSSHVVSSNVAVCAGLEWGGCRGPGVLGEDAQPRAQVGRASLW